MLEGLISSLLNRYLSSLVHLDSEQLNVGVWSGRLHLTNLAIRPSLFASLPFLLRRGRIGSFQLQLNWAKMASVPVQVTVDDVWLLLEVKQGTDMRGVGEWSEDEIRQWMEQQKQKVLEDAFAAASSLLASSGEAGSGFAATFIASVVDNVQIHVNRVHVCVEGPGRRKESYEEEEEEEEQQDSGGEEADSRHSSGLHSEEEKDSSDSTDTSHSQTATPTSAASLSAPSTPTAASVPSLSSTVLVSHPNSPHPSAPRWSVGVVLHSLSVVTTDSGGHQTFVKSTGSVVYKRVAVSGLSVYWDCWRPKERRPYADADSDESFAAYMTQPFLSSEDAAEAKEDRKSDPAAHDQQHHTADTVRSRSSLLPALNHILLPTEATVRLELSKHTASSVVNETKKQPRISASVTVSSISLQLNADQLRSISRATAQLSAALGADVSQQLRHAPLVSPALQPAAQGDARAWWRFAIGAHVAKIRERREEQSWQRILAARRDHDAYTPLYRAKLLAGRDGKVEDEWRRHQREEIEARWPARTLLVWRSLVNQQTRISVAYNQVRQMNAKEQQRAHPRSYLYTPIVTSATVAGWVGSFFYGGGGTASTEENEERLPEMSAGERDQLSRLLGYDPMGPIEQLASAHDRDAPLYRVELEFTQIAFTLYQPAIRSETVRTPHDELGSPQLSPFPHTSPSHARSRLDLAMLTISTLRAAAFIQAAETSVQLEVGGLHVEDCMQRDSPQFRYLVTSDSRNVQQVTTVGQDSTSELVAELKEDVSSAHSTSLIKVLYTHHDHSKQAVDNAEDGAAVAMEVQEMGVFTRTVSVAALPSTLLSVSDSVDLQFNTMHVNWNRTTISLLVQFLTAEDEESEEDDEDEGEEASIEIGKAAAEEQKQPEGKQDRDALRNRRRTMPAAAATRVSSPMQARRTPLHIRTRSTPVLPAAPQPLSSARSSSSSSRLHPSDPRPLLRLLRSKLTNVSRYREAREAAESETVGTGRAGKSVRKLQLNSNKQRRQSDEAQLAREESASMLPRPAARGHENTGKREMRYVQFKLNASMQSFSVCLNDELADVTLTQAEVTGLNVSLDQSQPDTGLRADPELDGSSSMKQQTMQVRGTVGGITVYDTHTFASAHPYSPHSPHSAGNRPSSSINPAHFGASSVLSLVPPRAATRVFFKHRSSDLALLTFSFSMQPQPVQSDLHHSLPDSYADHRTAPVHRGYDASLNLRLSSISAVISHDFFSPLIAYASEGLLKQATDKAAQTARKAIDNIKEDLESRSYLFKYVVAVDNPLVFFPHTAGAAVHPQRRPSWSPDSFASSPRRLSPIQQLQQSEGTQSAAPAEYLVLDLGRISVYNDFFMSEAEHSLIMPHTATQPQSHPLSFATKAPMERINLSLAAVNLLRASLASASTSVASHFPHPLASSSSDLPPAPLSAPAPHFSRRSASHDTLHEMRADFSVYGDGLPIQPVPHVFSSSAEATSITSDAGHFWHTAVKLKLLEDMDIQVKLVTPLGELRYVGLAAKAVDGDISTVHVNVNERIYAFLLSMYVHDFAPLLALADKPSAAASTTLPPAAVFDGATSIMEEQWGTELDEQLGASKPLSSIAEEKSESDVPATASAASAASAVDDISVNLSFREIFIDVQLSSDSVDVSHVPRSSSPFGNVHAAESGHSLSHFFFLDPALASSPAPFAHIRASTLHIVGRLRLDSSTGSTVGSEFQCSVAKLSVQDSRSECAHPLFRQIVGGHKDDVTLSTAARNRRRSTTTVFTTPATSATPVQSSSSSTAFTSPSLHPQALSVDWSSVSPYASGRAASPAALSSRPFHAQFLLTPVIPKSPTRSPLPVYHRLSASLQSHSLHTPLPPTILPDLVISGRQDGSGEMSVDVEFTAPRLVLSPGCLTAILHLSNVMNEITERILAAASNQPAGWDDLTRSASASSSLHQSSSFHTVDGRTHTTIHVPLTATAATAPPQSSSPAVASAAPAPKPTHVHVAIRDPQIWLMADASEHDSSSSHLTHSSTNLPHSTAQHLTVVQPVSRRRLNMAESNGEKSPNTAELMSDDELDDNDDEDDEQADDEKQAKERPSRAAQAAPKSLSCIVIRGQVEVNATIAGDSIQANVDMTELQALICYRAHHLRLARLALPPVPIFEPIHLNIDYDAQPDPDAIKGSVPPPLPIEHIVLSLSSLDACFSFLQISTAASILHAIVRVLPPELLFSSHTPVPSPSDPSVLIVPPTFKGSMQLQTASIELAIVNDAPGYYVPLMKFELSPVALSYTEGMPAPPAASLPQEVNQPPFIRQSSSRFSWPFSSSTSGAAASPSPSAVPAPLPSVSPKANGAMTVSLKATVAGSVYNSDIQRWEVFFDPWSIHVSGDDSNIAVTSTDMFAVTVTPSCIHTLVRGVESFQTHFLPTITALLASSDETLNTSFDEMDRSATPPRGSSAFSSPTASRKGSMLSPAAVDRHGASGMLHQPVASNPSADKASYFIVRNETGMRLQFWSVQDSGAVNGSRIREREKQTQTLESGEERTVEMRQYIGVGSGGSDAGRRWLYRSPALGLCVEAGNNSGRWDGWRPIEHISLAAAEETSSKPPVAALLSLNEERKSEESVAGLTVHRLLAVRNDVSDTQWHQRQLSADAPSSLLASFSSLTSPAASTHDLSSLMVSSPSSAVDSVVDTWLVCRLVAGSDAEGSSAKVLVVSSTLLAFNRTFLDLDLQLFDTSRGQTLFSTLLPSGQSVSLPVLCVPSKQVRLRVRPSGGAGAGPSKQWQWCDNGPRLSYVKQKAYRHTTVRCTIEPGDGGEPQRQSITHHRFFARVNVFRSTPSPITNVDTFSSASAAHSAPFTSSPTADDGVYTIAFDPPLAYKNMLGCELDYTLTVKHKPASLAAHNLDITALQPYVTYTGTLPHKQEVHWYALDLGVASSSTVLLSIRRSLSLTSQPLPPSSVTSVVGDSRFFADNDQRLLSPFNHSWSTEWSPHVVIHSTIRASQCRVQPTVPLRDRHGQILDVALDYSDLSSSPVDSARIYPFAGAGPGLVTSFVPYWLFNCTGLPLVYGTVIRYDTEMCAGQSEEEIERRAAVLREKEDALHADATAEHWFTMAVSHVGGVSYTGWHPSLRQKPYEQQPFLLSDEQIAMRFLDKADDESAKDSNRRASIRLPNTDWSKPFSVDAVGTHGAIELEEKLPSSHPARPCRMYEFGVSVSLHPNIRFHRTKTILIHPRVLLLNATTLPLQYRQVGTNECVSVSLYEQVAVHRFDSGKKGRLSLRIHAYGWQWSARHYGVAVGEVGSRCMRVRNTSTQQVAVLRLDTRLVQATFEVTVSMAWQDELHEHLLHPAASREDVTSSSQLVGRTVSAPYFDHQPESSSTPSPPSPVSPISPVFLHPRSIVPLTSSSLLHRSATTTLPSPHREHRQRHMSASPEDSAARNRLASTAPGADNVPYRLENRSQHTLVYYQADEEYLSARMQPHSTALYAWDEPDGSKELIIAIVDAITLMEEAGIGYGYESNRKRSKPRVIGRFSLDRIVKYPPITLPADRQDGAEKQVTVNVLADGRVRVLRLSDGAASVEADDGDNAVSSLSLSVGVRLAGLSLSLVSHAMPTAGGSSGLVLHRDPVSHELYHELDANVARAGRLDPPISRQELIYVQVSSVELRVRQSKERLGVDAAVGSIQVDNQLHAAVFPVIFCPVVMKKDVGSSSASSSFLSASVVKSLDRSRDDVLFLPHLSIRLQKVQLNVEEQLVSHLLHFATLVSPAFTSSSSSPASAAATSSKLSGRTVLSSSIGHANAHVTSDLAVSSSQLLTAQRRRAKRAGKTGVAGAGMHANSGIRQGESLRREWDSSDRLGDLRTRQLSSTDQSSALQLSGSVRRRTLRPSSSTSSLTSVSSAQQVRLAAPSTEPLVLCLQELTIYPIQINVSYSASASLSSDTAFSPHSHPLRFLLRALNVTILNIDAAPLRLSSLHLSDVFSSPSHLADRIRWHFLLQLSTGFYSLLGSSDLLGNPVGLFTSISSGIQSFFYEPVAGLTESPQAFSLGVIKGTVGLIQHSLYGVTNTTRGIMSSIAKGLTSLSQSSSVGSSSRSVARRRERESLARTASTFSSSYLAVRMLWWLHSSTTGLLYNTARTGLSFVSSAVDLVSSTADSISHAVNPQAKATRIRPPAVFELGLIDRRRMKTETDTRAMDAFLEHYLREHANQLYYCCVTSELPKLADSVASKAARPRGKETVVSLVLLTTRLLVLYSRPTAALSQSTPAAPVLMHDLPLSDLISVRQSPGDQSATTLWYEQPVHTAGSAADKHSVQQVSLSLTLPPHLLQLLHAVISVNHAQQQMTD